MQNLRWMRVPGDTVFAIGAVALVIFVGTIRAGSMPTAMIEGTAPPPAAK
jgi:nitric oxide reductase subunit B